MFCEKCGMRISGSPNPKPSDDSKSEPSDTKSEPILKATIAYRHNQHTEAAKQCVLSLYHDRVEILESGGLGFVALAITCATLAAMFFMTGAIDDELAAMFMLGWLCIALTILFASLAKNAQKGVKPVSVRWEDLARIEPGEVTWGSQLLDFRLKSGEFYSMVFPKKALPDWMDMIRIQREGQH